MNKLLNNSPTHEFRATCPYCGKAVRMQVNLKSSTTFNPNSDVCKHADMADGKHVTFQDQGHEYPTKAAYQYANAKVSRI